MAGRLVKVACTLGAGLLAGLFALPASAAADAAQMQALRQAAQQTGEACLHQMHHDTDEFSDCVDARWQRSAGQPAVQLGQGYLGLVGCISAGRISVLHADVCARDFLGRVEPLRKRLGISDDDLCPAVQGGCPGRLAQIELLRRQLQRP